LLSPDVILKPKFTKTRFLLGLRPRPHTVSLQRSTYPVAGFRGSWP